MRIIYNLALMEQIADILTRLEKSYLSEVGSVEGVWLELPRIPVKEPNGETVGYIEHENEIGWFYIPIEAYEGLQDEEV